MNTNIKKEEESPKDILPIQTNAQEQENKSQCGKIIEIIKIEYTPFSMVVTDSTEEKKVFLTLGNKRITELITREQAEKKIRFKDWDMISALITIITEKVVEEITLEKALENIKSKKK